MSKRSISSKLMSAAVTAAMVSTVSLPAFAKPVLKILSQKTSHYRPDYRCGEDCTLEDFTLVEQKKRLTDADNGPAMNFYMTDVRAAYRTKSVEDLEKYAVVQFIRGCQFETAWDGKTAEKMLTVSRDYFGGQATFLHPEWMIDSDSTDPIYSSMEGYGRFALLRWNKNPASLDPNTATYYGQAKPKSPSVFVTDLPGAAFVSPEKRSDGRLYAKNISLEFMTCIFRTADLPEVTDPQGSNIPMDKVVSCLNWNNSFIYSFQKGKFESPTELDPICRTPLSEGAKSAEVQSQ